jgi:hypothetical protein
MSNARVEPELQIDQSFLDGAQMRFDRGQVAREDVRRGMDVRPRVRWFPAVEHRVQMAGMPPQGYGQRLQRARTPSPLRRVVLQLTHDRLRYVRPLGEISLSHADFGQPTVHRLGNGRPVRSRHRFSILPRGPPCAPRLAARVDCLGPIRRTPRRFGPFTANER